MKRSLLREIIKYKTMYLFLIPALIISAVFQYYPMFGVIMAFQKYNPVKGFLRSEFVGIAHFVTFLKDYNFYYALKNTLGISLIMLFIGFPIPIMFALLINEIKDGFFKRIAQSVSYLPHFISWVVIGSMAYRLLDYEYGPVNILLNSLGVEKIAFLREPKYFWGILTSTAVWKELGWNSIIYLAALSSIDSQIYEAAEVDGAGKFRKLISITLPGIAPVVSLMFILAVGHLVRAINGAGFEAILNLHNAMVAEASITLDYYVYFQGIRMGQMSLASAVGLSQSVVGLILVVMTNAISRKIKGYGVF